MTSAGIHARSGWTHRPRDAPAIHPIACPIVPTVLCICNSANCTKERSTQYKGKYRFIGHLGQMGQARPARHDQTRVTLLARCCQEGRLNGRAPRGR